MQERFNQYCLTKEIASKPSGSVYLAHRINHASPKLALRVFKTSDFTTEEQSQKFLRKLEKIKQLKHSSIVPIINFGVEQEQTYVVREYLTSSSLRHRLDILSPQRMDLQDALRIILQIGKALSYAHQRHILHGNLKPENILFNDKGEALLADFGLASFTDMIQRDDLSHEQTMGYRAPEQLIGSITEKTDQYALACLAYELFTGYAPFSTQSVSSVAFPFSVDGAPAHAIARKEHEHRDQAGLTQGESACDNRQCPDYKKESLGNIRKFGKTRRGAQRWQCKTCQITWSSSSSWTKQHTNLIPLSDLVPDLPELIEEAVLKAMAKDPSERYANSSIFLRALEITLLLPTSSSTHSQLGSPVTSLSTDTIKPLGKPESEISLAASHLLERWTHGNKGNHANKALAIPIADTYHSSKATAIPIADTYHSSKTATLPITDTYHSSKTVAKSKTGAYRSNVETLPEGRRSQFSKQFSPTLWLAFALSGIALLLGTVALYTLVPSQSPASSKPAASSPTVQPTVQITTIPTAQPSAQTTHIPMAQATKVPRAKPTSVSRQTNEPNFPNNCSAPWQFRPPSYPCHR